MDTDRYEILDTIAMGEFATVSHARDRDLGREVAVKQIHAQYLADPRQLARYWQEAQLLASLQHPNILTVYDVVRPRGWLILELMRSSLKPAAEGEPMDLDQLRSVLISCLSGLAFLHSNKVIHGDVKPSNILVSPQNHVKLGDFGLARRASNEEGSLLKGTTKYMAPELLSAQFGRVGRASDLYSLGIAAYELMVGGQFESLLPTLSTFGRDKQLAWMMWHSTADVKLPEVHRVLEGVPDDLAHVIQRLIAKDQSQRYTSAPEALQDLRSGHSMGDGLIDSAVAEAEAAAAKITRKKKRVRSLTLLCVGMVVALSAMIMFHLFTTPRITPAKPLEEMIHGTISDVYPVSHELGVSPSDGSAVRRIIVKDDEDIIYVNGQRHLLEELERGDVVDVTKSVNPQTRNYVREIRAARPGRFATGVLVSKDESLRTFEMKLGQVSDQTDLLKIFVPANLKIMLNGAATFGDRPVTMAMLAPGDRLKATYEYQEASVNQATKLEVLRQVELQGTLAADFDARARLLSIVDDKHRIVKLPFGSEYKIFVNHEPVADPMGLKRGDRVLVTHDTYIAEVMAQRTLGAEGIIEQVRFEPPQSLVVAGNGGPKATYSVGSDCKILLGGETVPFDKLRAGDRVTIEHNAIDPKSDTLIAATSIAAERPADPARRALVIVVQNYDDARLSKLDSALIDAAAVVDSLTKRYRVPADQVRVFNDPSAVLLEPLPGFLKGIPADARLLVYYVGHAWKVDKGPVYLAPKDFRSDKPEANGRQLQWLVDSMEASPAKEKLLLLDASHLGSGVEQAYEPSTAEMIGSLNPQPNRALLRTVIAVASCQKGQRGIELPDKQHGLFAACLAEGYGGAADVNRNTRVEPTQLFTYVQKAMAVAGQGKQTPQLFLPDDRPPRLSEGAKKLIRHMADRAAQAKIDPDELDSEYQDALHLAGTEPEPRLIYGLLLTKRNDSKGREKALQHFQAMKSEMPDRLLVYAALAWLRLHGDRHTFTTAVNELTAMMGKIPLSAGPEASYASEARFLFEWSGQLREYAAGVGEPSRQLSESVAALDSAVAEHGPQASELYAKGRQASAAVLAKFDADIAQTTDEVEASKIKVDRHQLSQYADFPLDRYIRLLRMQLDQ